MAAGCFTRPYFTALKIDALAQGVKNGWIEEGDLNGGYADFCSKRGRWFYGAPIGNDDNSQKIILERKE